MSNLTYTLEDLRAEMQEKTLRSAWRTLEALMGTAGFPRPLPTLPGMSRLRWSKPAVDRWIETSGRDAPPPATTTHTDATAQRRHDIEAAYGWRN